MAGIKVEQKVMDQDLSTLVSGFFSSADENETPGKTATADHDEPETAKPCTLTSDPTGPADSVPSASKDLLAQPSDYAMMPERFPGNFRHPCRAEADARLTPPFQDHVIVIDGSLLQPWRRTGAEQGLSSDSRIAAFLLDRYEDSKAQAPGAGHLCSFCQTPLTLVCLTCSPAQSKYKENTLPPAVSGDNDQDSHSGEDDNDSSIPSAAGSMSGDGRATQEQSKESLSTGSLPSIHEGGGSCKDSRQSFSLPQEVDLDSCKAALVKIEDIASEESVKRLQRAGFLSSVKVEKLKPLGDEKLGRSVRRKKMKPKSDKITVVKIRKQSGSQKRNLTQTDRQNVECKVGDKRERGQCKREPPSQKSDTGEKSFKCSVCSIAFKSRSNCHAHELRHVGEQKPHKCEQCPAAFHSRGNLVAHRRKHTGERPFCCEVCGKSFARSTTLQQHRRVHTDDRPFKCEECGEMFRQRGMVVVHRRKVHTLERPFSCNVCGASFVVKGHLQVHMQSHTDHRPYLCEECGASFKQKGILETHRMIHTGVRSFSCDICCKSFYREVDVRSHKKSHFNVCDVVCTVCGAAFSNNSRLKRHMQKHTGFRPFKCSECGKNFASNSERKVHMRIHTGDKPYVCDVCKRGFQTMGNMKKHRNNRHKQAPPYVSPEVKNNTQTQQEQRVKPTVPPAPKTDLLLSQNRETGELALEERNPRSFSYSS